MAIVKRLHTNFCYAIGERNGLQTFAAFKGKSADKCYTIRNDYVLQIVASVKASAPQLRHAPGEHHAAHIMMF